MALRNISEELYFGYSEECSCCTGCGAACGAGCGVPCDVPCGAAGGAAEGVRVRVALAGVYADARARAMVWAPRARCVRWLGERLRRQFLLHMPFALAVRGYLLPAAEPLAVLERDDLVEVIALGPSFDEVVVSDPSNKMRTQADSTASVAQDETDNKLHLYQDKQSGLSNPVPSDIQKVQDNGNVLACEQHDPDIETSTEKEDNDESKELEQLKRQALELLDKNYSSSEGPAPKRARRRRRRRRPQASACPGISDSIGTPENDDEEECVSGSNSRNIKSMVKETDVVNKLEIGSTQSQQPNAVLEFEVKSLADVITTEALEADVQIEQDISKEELNWNSHDHGDMPIEQVIIRTEGKETIIAKQSREAVHEMVGEIGAVVVVRNRSVSRAPRLVRPLADNDD